LIAGTLAFATHAASRAWRPAGPARGRGGALRAPGLRTLMLVFALIGAAFGAVEVAVPVAAEETGVTGSTGLLLGLWGLGSLVGGLLAARAGAPADAPRRLGVLLAALAAGHLTLVVAGAPLLLAALLFVAGLAISPAFACAYGMVDGLAPPGTVTEAYTWLGTGIAGGLAVGAALAGVLAESAGAGAAFTAAAAACACASLAGGLRRATLAPLPEPAPA
jgi:MFS family permease